MKTLKIGDVIELNGRRLVVYAMTTHPYYVIEARVADPVTNQRGMCVTASGQHAVVGKDLHAAAYQCLLMSFECGKDAKRAKVARNKEFHRERAHTWMRRCAAIRRVLEGRAVA